MIRTLNTKPDKYLIECIELDLYDAMYNKLANKLNHSLFNEVKQILINYQNVNAIIGFNIIEASTNKIVVEISAPTKVKIICMVP